MNQISISQTRVSLFLISLTFLAILIEFVICQFKLNLPNRDLINLLMLYLFSLFLPAVGLTVFIKNTRNISSRWYWGLPLLIGLILNTSLRDFMFMFPFDPRPFTDNLIYGQPFLTTFPIFYKWHILELMPYGHYKMNFAIMNFISIFFSAATALFCLSVPEEKRKKFMLPFALSIIAVLSNFIQFIVGWTIQNRSFSYELNYISSTSFSIYSMAILFLGLSFIGIAVIYDL
jgi:hypothetical protein